VRHPTPRTMRIRRRKAALALHLHQLDALDKPYAQAKRQLASCTS
jgi:hypothetical protein